MLDVEGFLLTSMSLYPHFINENTAFQRAYDISEII